MTGLRCPLVGVVLAFTPLLARAGDEAAAAPPGAEAATAKDRGLVASLPLNSVNAKLSASDRVLLDEYVRTVSAEELSHYGYTVLTGDTTLRLLADNGIDAEKACEASCALDAAREVKAKLFIAGSVTTAENRLVALLRVFDSATGRQLGSAELDAGNVLELCGQFKQKAPEFFERALQLPKNALDAAPAPPRSKVLPIAMGLGTLAALGFGAWQATRSHEIAAEKPVATTPGELKDRQDRVGGAAATAYVGYGVGFVLLIGAAVSF